jgi:CheY-like chemotaxis protein
MLTEPTGLFGREESAAESRDLGPIAGAQKVAIVNGSPEVLSLIENILSAGHYDIVFVESVTHAYSHIKRVRPDLVIVCLQVDNMDALQVLSMLKLDEETRGIPVLTYTADYTSKNDETSEDEESDDTERAMFPSGPGMWMN